MASLSDLLAALASAENITVVGGRGGAAEENKKKLPKKVHIEVLREGLRLLDVKNTFTESQLVKQKTGLERMYRMGPGPFVFRGYREPEEQMFDDKTSCFFTERADCVVASFMHDDDGTLDGRPRIVEWLVSSRRFEPFVLRDEE